MTAVVQPSTWAVRLHASGVSRCSSQRVSPHVSGSSITHGIQNTDERRRASVHSSDPVRTNCAAKNVTSAPHTDASATKASTRDFHERSAVITVESITGSARRAEIPGGRHWLQGWEAGALLKRLLTTGRAARTTSAASAFRTTFWTTGRAATRTTLAAATTTRELEGTVFDGRGHSSLFSFVDRTALVLVVWSEGFKKLRGSGRGALPVRLAAFAAFGTTGGLAAFATFRSTRRTTPGRPHFKGTVFDGRRDLVEFRSLELAALVGIEGGEGRIALAQFRGSFRWRWGSRAIAALSTLPAGTARAASARALGDGETQ